MTPRTLAEKAGSFARHALPALGLAIIHLATGTASGGALVHPIAVLPFLAFAVYATSLSITYARAVDSAGSSSILAAVNADVEHRRGTAFGFAMLVAGVLA
jgi:hypothetical protein